MVYVLSVLFDFQVSYVWIRWVAIVTERCGVPKDAVRRLGNPIALFGFFSPDPF